ncbi:hypothetical protein PSPO01_07567 [Paraphaeosphaeria sporulosa]
MSTLYGSLKCIVRPHSPAETIDTCRTSVLAFTMKHQPEPSAHEQLTSSASASQYPAKNYEFDPVTSDARLDTILDDTPLLPPTSDTHQSLEEATDEFFRVNQGFRQLCGGDGFSSIGENRNTEVTLMSSQDGGVEVPHDEIETQETVKALWDTWGQVQLQEGKNLPVAQKQTEEPTYEPSRESITSLDEQKLSETQKTEAEPSSGWNPYSDEYVDHYFVQSSMAKKRMNDELNRGGAAKKRHSQSANALLLSPPPSSPKLPVVQADAGDRKAFYLAAPPLGQARYDTVDEKLHAELSRYLPPTTDQNSVQMGPRYNAASSLYQNLYAPPPLHYNAYAPRPSPYSLQPALSYSGYGQATSSPAYAQPPLADCTPVPAYPGYVPASLTDPAAVHYTPQALLPTIPAAPKAKSPAQKKTRAPAQKAKTVPGSDITVLLHHITRGIQNKTTEVLYQAALDINQFIHEWHGERDRLELIMEKRLADYDDTQPDSPGNQKYSPKERELRKTLMSKIRAFEKKFDTVNAELQKRGVLVPI